MTVRARDLIDWDSAEMEPRIRDMLESALIDPKKISRGLTSISVQQFVGKRDANAEPEGVIQNPNHFDKSYHGATMSLVKDIGNFLVKTYPGWGWVIQVNEFGHMIYITNSHLHPTTGMRLRMEDVIHDPSLRHIKKNAGEILERFDMLRMGLVGENLTRLVEAPRDAVGNCIPHIDDLKDKKAATQAEVARKIAKGEITIYKVNGQTMVRIKK